MSYDVVELVIAGLEAIAPPLAADARARLQGPDAGLLAHVDAIHQMTGRPANHYDAPADRWRPTIAFAATDQNGGAVEPQGGIVIVTDGCFPLGVRLVSSDSLILLGRAQAPYQPIADLLTACLAVNGTAAALERQGMSFAQVAAHPDLAVAAACLMSLTERQASAFTTGIEAPAGGAGFRRRIAPSRWVPEGRSLG